MDNNSPASLSSDTPLYDLVVVGGGINGVGIAADAAGRGLRVLLCEQHDLAAHTSSTSSKLIHGGLRYLEQGEFRLVREALAEREILLAKAPHIVRPLRFLLPLRPQLRPAWMIRLGLFLYDRLSGHGQLPASQAVRFAADSPLKPEIRRGFEFADCQVDDARLVVLNAMAARERGAIVCPRTRCLSAQRQQGLWRIELQRADGHRSTVRTRALVNATGPWVTRFIEDVLHQSPPRRIRLVQGSHLIAPRLYEGNEAYILQNEDRRLVFVIPYLQRYSLIGTTDREFAGDPAEVNISETEIDYLLRVVNAHFKRPLQRSDIRHSFSGVRPLLDDESHDPAAIARDYSLSLSTGQGQAPLLSVFGGKLTTYRRLAETALEQLSPFLPPMKPSWTAGTALPGGEELEDPDVLAGTLLQEFTWLPDGLAQRWAQTYGSRAYRLLEGATQAAHLGEHLGGGLYGREVDYLCREEWAEQADDILWRRTKLGLLLPPAAQRRLAGYLSERPAVRPCVPTTEPGPPDADCADTAVPPPATAP
ncbi:MULTISPECIES: glycerol-3-phosphate dehydrogenase [Azotobacter]|uniref:glycerol-3-phosphate dehydrogenase n=1 Tax=Azotobacter TaxID=352 RepID=UPI00003893CA|nr:glycerol-3-phosphate dehydrogenase [Azotobacter vinelandii]GLK61283.1 glycerol-3-phosphate dehydrogenase [Azotobacter vinelandii]SFX98224.1 homodimeric glycerol 3-phosphate dehydrogenase (quinone) [Azotobacter vinelandii]